MKNKLFTYSFLPVLGLGLFLGNNVAPANAFFGGKAKPTPEEIATNQQTMFQHEAELLGISIDEVKGAWAQGKTLMEIAADHGITEEQLQKRMKDAQTAELKARLQALVDKNVITQAQADQRLKAIEKMSTERKTKVHRERDYDEMREWRGSVKF